MKLPPWTDILNRSPELAISTWNSQMNRKENLRIVENRDNYWKGDKRMIETSFVDLFFKSYKKKDKIFMNHLTYLQNTKISENKQEIELIF